MTKTLCHVSMLDMFKFSLFLLVSLFLSSASFAYEATVSVYTFENKGTNDSVKVKLEDRVTPLPVTAPWFDWKCVALKQIDGVNITCERGPDMTETKIFCYVHNSKEARYLKVSKNDNFVSFETKCQLTHEEQKRIARAKAKKKKKLKAPESELIPVPPKADAAADDKAKEPTELKVIAPDSNQAPPADVNLPEKTN